MIDRKVLILIGALAVVAILILSLGFVNISFGGGGDSYTALFDKMEDRREEMIGNPELVLGSEYTDDDIVRVRDTIIAITCYGGSQTTFYFMYTGTVWINEYAGTNFEVILNVGEIRVQNSVFGITVNGNFTASFDVGDYVTLQTTVGESGDDLVLNRNWVVVLE